MFLLHRLAQCTKYKDLDLAKVPSEFWRDITRLITVEKHKDVRGFVLPIYEELWMRSMRGPRIQSRHHEMSFLKTELRTSSGLFEAGRVEGLLVHGGWRCLAKAYSEVQRRLCKSKHGSALTIRYRRTAFCIPSSDSRAKDDCRGYCNETAYRGGHGSLRQIPRHGRIGDG